MTTLTKLFLIVQYNNYNELFNVLKSTKKFDLKTLKGESIITTSIKYRSKECFDLLIESDYFAPNLELHNGLHIALEYYGNSKNDSNSYYLHKLISKGVLFDYNALKLIIEKNMCDEFMNYILNFINEDPEENFSKLFKKAVHNIDVFKMFIKMGLSMGLITNDIIKFFLEKTLFDTLLVILIEFNNHNIDFLFDTNLIISCLHKNIQCLKFVEFLVNHIIASNKNIDLSDFIKDYLYFSFENDNYYDNYYCYSNKSTKFITKLYDIYRSYDILSKLNCNFFEDYDILNSIFHYFVELKHRSYSLNSNELLFMKKFFDMLLDKNIINKNMTITKPSHITITNICITKKITTNKRYELILEVLHLLNYLENKGLKSEGYNDFKTLVIPQDNIDDFNKNKIATKLKPLTKNVMK